MTVVCEPPTESRERVAEWVDAMKFVPELDDRAEALSLLASRTRLRMLFVIHHMGKVCVCDLAEILGVSQSAASQHLAKFRAYRWVTSERDGQTLYYALAESDDVAWAVQAGLAGTRPPEFDSEG